MDLSERLETIAKEIKIGETAADIGSDHGFLPVYLLEKGISPKVIITDISPGSLEKAGNTCREHGLADSGAAELRLGDGLKVISPAEVDVVVIAGMGGILISEIIGSDLEKSRTYSRFILQPRTKAGLLRSRLTGFGFEVVDLRIVKERGRLCEVMTVIPGRGRSKGLQASAFRDPNVPFADPGAYDKDPDVTAAFDFPDILIGSGDPLARKYLEINKNKQLEIIRRLEQNGSLDMRSRAFAEARIKRIDHLLSEFDR